MSDIAKKVNGKLEDIKDKAVGTFDDTREKAECRSDIIKGSRLLCYLCKSNKNQNRTKSCQLLMDRSKRLVNNPSSRIARGSHDCPSYVCLMYKR